MGTGVARDYRSLRFRVIKQIALAWMTTIPGAAIMGGLLYLIIRLFV
jgi:phosphate/sulfate permease